MSDPPPASESENDVVAVRKPLVISVSHAVFSLEWCPTCELDGMEQLSWFTRRFGTGAACREAQAMGSATPDGVAKADHRSNQQRNTRIALKIV